MQHAADGVERFEAHDGFGAIVSDLISLVEHVQASINMVERAIAREITVGDHENSNVIILDDVTPQYVKASTALKSCSADLGPRGAVPARCRSLFTEAGAAVDGG